MVRRIILKQPGQVRRAQGLARGQITGQGYQRVVCVAALRPRRPAFLVRRVMELLHKTVFTGKHAGRTCMRRAIQVDAGADRTAGHFQGAHEATQHGSCPATLIRAPAIVHRLAQDHGDRPVRQCHAFNFDGRADLGMLQVFIGHGANPVCGDITNACRPFRGALFEQFPHFSEGR